MVPKKCPRSWTVVFIIVIACFAPLSLGLSALFDGQRVRAVSYRSTAWEGFSSPEGTTLEFWVTFLDSNIRWNPMVHYASLSAIAGVGSSAELSFEIGGFFGTTAMGWQRSRNFAHCYRCGTPFFDGFWHHIVTTLDHTTGDSNFYINGTLMGTVAGSAVSPVFRTLPRAGGELLVGFGLKPTAGNDIYVNDVANMLLDDLRIHNRALTASEVQAGVWKHPHDMPPNYTDSLVLHWGFDDPDSDVELDISGNGAHGMRGGLDNMEDAMISFEDEKVEVAKPLHSIAPVLSTGPGNISTFIVPGQATQILGFGGDQQSNVSAVSAVVRVSSLPSFGKLLLGPSSSSQPVEPAQDLPLVTPVYYHTQKLDIAPQLLDQFEFQVEGRTHGITIHSMPPCSTPSRTIRAVNGEWKPLRLGLPCADSSNPVVEILAPPTRGKLFKFFPGRQIWPFFNPLEPQSVGEEITTFPVQVQDKKGVVVFLDDQAPPKDAAQYYNTTLRYRWVFPDASADEAQLTILTEIIPRAPRVLEPSFEPAASDAGIPGVIRLKMNSIASSSFAAYTNYRITANPKFGTLQQEGPPGTGGTVLTALSDSRPVLRQYANHIPAYSPEHGPAFSSQQGLCQECCSIQATCNPTDCARLNRSDWDRCENGLPKSSHAKYLPGPPPQNWPDIISRQGENEGWSPYCPDCGEEFFVVGFETAVYAAQISVFETLTPGTVVKLSVSENYAGNQTNWTVMWSGPPQDTPPDRARTFTPSTCPSRGFKTRYVRVDLRTDAKVGIKEVAAVALLGSEDGSYDWLVSPEGRLQYVPTPGISFTGQDVVDSFSVAASVCSAPESDPVEVEIPSYLFATNGTFFGNAQQAYAFIGEYRKVQVDLTEAISHLSEAISVPGLIPETISDEDFTVKLSLSSCFDLKVGDDKPTVIGNKIVDSVDDKESAVFDCSDFDTEAEGGQLVLGADHSFWVHSRLRGVLQGELVALATAMNVTYHLKIAVTMECPPEESLYNCASSAQQCIEAGLVFEPAGSRCREEERTSRLILWITLGCIVALAFFLLALAVVIFRSCGKAWRARMNRRGPPMRGENLTLVITDIQGSTTLWDNFPDELSTCIALHHSCMRSLLGQCNGYEVATEGDSFKCAFQTPEDAILWCISVQLELLTAPWSECLEDGGASLLRGVPDWADVNRLSIPKHWKEIIQTMAADGVTGMTKSDVAKYARTLFSPAEAAKTQYSSNWVAWQSAHDCVQFEPAKSMLPLFRGLRVRMGVHTGIADVVKIHENTKRVTYGGSVSKVAKAVSDAPCGGQIIITGETMAAITSMTDLQAQVARHCNGWRSVAGPDGAPNTEFEAAAMTIMHLGAHVLSGPPLSPHAGVARAAEPAHPVDEDQYTIDIKNPEPNTKQEKQNLKGGKAKSFGDLMQSMSSDSGALTQQPASAEDDCSGLSGLNLLMLSDDVLKAQEGIGRAHEILSVIPWPLRSRAMYYPVPSSVEEVTPPWYKAPPASDVTILFSFICDWSKIKEFADEDASASIDDALESHNQLVRALLRLHNGYEMEGEDGNFVCAFRRAIEALDFSMELQKALLCVDWEPEILRMPFTCEQYTSSGQMTFRGLRVKTGICTGTAVRAQVSARTGRMEYFGPVMNHAARVAAAGHGGQVLLHQSAWEDLVKHSSDVLENSSKVLFTARGQHKLKGINKSIEIVEAVPADLSSRQFPPIKTVRKSNMLKSTSSFNIDLDRLVQRFTTSPSQSTGSVEEYLDESDYGSSKFSDLGSKDDTPLMPRSTSYSLPGASKP